MLTLLFNSEQEAVPYVHDRKQFGVPVGTFQLMQGKIADMYTKISATRSYVYAVGRGEAFRSGPLDEMLTSLLPIQRATPGKSVAGCVLAPNQTWIRVLSTDHVSSSRIARV